MKLSELLPRKYTNKEINEGSKKDILIGSSGIFASGWSEAINACLAALQGKVIILENVKVKEIERKIEDSNICTYNRKRRHSLAQSIYDYLKKVASE